MAFTISSGSRKSYSEGSYVTFTWRMERPDGQFLRNTTVPYTIEGLSASDVVGGRLSGSVAINSLGSGSLTIQLTNDLTTEGDESFFIRSNANFTPFTSNTVTVFDTSVGTRPSPPPSPPPAPAPAPVPVPPPSGDRTHFGSRQADTITGTGFQDTFMVTSGADRFNGGDGSDTMNLSNLYSVLKEGERLLIGRELPTTFSDIIVRADLTKTARNVDLATTYTRFQLFEQTSFDINVTLTSVENVIGTQFADYFKGNASDNLLRGFAGRDTLIGGDGNDTLDGGDGADSIEGGDGVDTAVYAGSAQDYRFSRSGSLVEVSRTVNGRTEADILTGIEKIQFTQSTVDLSSLLPALKTHSVTAITQTVNEGSMARFEIRVTGYGSGERVPYSISGSVTGEDLLNVPLASSVAVDASGRGMIEFMVTADNRTEGQESLSVRVVDAVSTMMVNDTSVSVGSVGTERDDTLTGTASGDIIDGRGGNDRIDGLAGNDTLRGGSGDDYIAGGLGDDEIDGQAGADFMMGGEGNDTYYVDNTGDVVSELVGMRGGVDSIISSVSFTIGLDSENLILTGNASLNGTGNALNNRITGNRGSNILLGEIGNDSLFAGEGDDRLDGGSGTDSLTGEAGRDIFAFTRTDHSLNAVGLRDVINDFIRGQDLIDLSAIDARSSTTRNDAFTFLFSAPVNTTQANGAVWFSGGILYASTDGTLAAELAIHLTGVTTLTAGDLIL